MYSDDPGQPAHLSQPVLGYYTRYLTFKDSVMVFDQPVMKALREWVAASRLDPIDAIPNPLVLKDHAEILNCPQFGFLKAFEKAGALTEL